MLHISQDVTSDVFTAGMMVIMLFWVWVPSWLIRSCLRFGHAYCLHIQGWSDNVRNKGDCKGLQEGKPEGKGQSDKPRQRLSQSYGQTPTKEVLQLSLTH